MAQFFKPQKKQTNTKHSEYQILRLDHQGDGIAFVDKKPVFIAGALPNEKVLAQLTEDKRHYGRARLIKVLTPCASRSIPFCKHYKSCGGCQLQHFDHKAQLEAKKESLNQLMRKFAGVSIEQAPEIVGESLGYRRRARLSLKLNKEEGLQLGFRQRASNEIVNITDCPVLSLPINQLLAPISALLSSLRGRRILGHIEFVEADNGIVFLLRTIKKLHLEDVNALTQFCTEKSIIFYLEQGDEAPVRLVGDAPFYQLGTLKLDFEPKDFIQINSKVNQQMVAQAIAWLAPEKTDRVLDLFCGLGNFSLPLAQKAGEVVGVEGVAEMVTRASDNARLNNLTNVTFHHANLEDISQSAKWAEKKYDKILLDPARAGALGVMPYIAKSGASQVVYVSCNLATLARDCQVLLENGYRLARLGILDMFPHTGHVESMGLFLKD